MISGVERLFVGLLATHTPSLENACSSPLPIFESGCSGFFVAAHLSIELFESYLSCLPFPGKCPVFPANVKLLEGKK